MAQNAGRGAGVDDELDDFENDQFMYGDQGDDELDDNNGNDYGDPDPAIAAFLERREAELLEALEKGDTSHPIYPKWQRILSRKDKQLNDQRVLIEQALERIEKLQDMVDGAKVGFDWVSNELLDNLPETQRAKAEMSLREAALKQQEGAMKRRAEPKPSPTDDDADGLPQWFVEQQEKFIAGRKAMAKRAGVDPESKELDFGEPGEPIVVRLDKFEESLNRLIEQKDESRIDAVRRKGPAPSTRGGGGTKAGGRMGPLNDKTTLQRGAEQRLRDILAGKYD